MPTELAGIYVINVRAFTERKKHISAQLAKHQLTAEFILEWDRDDLTPDIIDRYFNENQLSPEQQSCALKHITALERISQSSSAYYLVLEDDAQLSDDFEQGLANALNESSQFPGAKVIFIGSGGNFYTPKSKRVKGQHLYPGSRGRFADSYIIDKQTAQLRLDWIKQHKVSAPIDNQFELIDKQTGIQMLWLEDPVVEQGSKTGTFNSTLEPAPPAWLQKIDFTWEKLRRKYIYQLWK